MNYKVTVLGAGLAGCEAALVLMSGLSWAAPAVWPEIFAGLGLCCVGGIGGACACC